MRFFIDTANIEEIKEANDLGVICGVTTNPSLIAKEGRDFIEVVKEITEIVDGPISAEVISLNHEGMVTEADKLSQSFFFQNNDSVSNYVIRKSFFSCIGPNRQNNKNTGQRDIAIRKPSI